MWIWQTDSPVMFLSIFNFIYRGVIDTIDQYQAFHWSILSILFNIYASEITLRNAVLRTCLNKNLLLTCKCSKFCINWIPQSIGFRAPYCTPEVLLWKTYQMPYYFHSNFYIYPVKSIVVAGKIQIRAVSLPFCLLWSCIELSVNGRIDLLLHRFLSQSVKINKKSQNVVVISTFFHKIIETFISYIRGAF